MPLPYPTVGLVTGADLSLNADVFPDLPGRDFIQTKAPIFATGVKTSASGRETRDAKFSAPRWAFKVRHNFLRDLAAKPEVQKLLAFFMSRQGKFGFFFYLDEDDYQVAEYQFGTGDGTTKTFQLSRPIAPGTPYSYVEPVYAVWETPTVKKAGVAQTYTTHYTIGAGGKITFVTAPTAGQALTWAGKFLYVCRFDVDRLDIEQIVKTLWSQDGLPFISIKP
jgi:uncharacterized protein (TIGR02217 family)